jgi:hypothetical protein
VTTSPIDAPRQAGPLPRREQRELADLRDLVCGKDPDGVDVGARDAIEQPALARLVIADRWIVLDGFDEPGDALTEPALELVAAT